MSTSSLRNWHALLVMLVSLSGSMSVSQVQPFDRCSIVTTQLDMHETILPRKLSKLEDHPLMQQAARGSQMHTHRCGES
jgi:hypothetical protein